MFKIIVAVIAVSLTVSSSWGHIGGQISMQDIRDIKPQKYCGTLLAKALSLLCYVDSEKVGKRTTHSSIYNAIMSPIYKNEHIPYWPWLSVEKARSMDLSSRGKRYIVDECCFKECNIDELMSYC